VDPNVAKDYYQVIGQPIDLGTIKKRLDTHTYETPDEFARDVRLVWSNCYQYNAPGTEVYIMAKALDDFFESKYREMPGMDESIQNSQMLAMQKQMKQMEKALKQQHQLMAQQQEAMLQQQQAMLQQQQQGMGFPGMQGAMPAAPPAKRQSTGKRAPGQQQSSYSLVPQVPIADREMSYDEKAALSGGINKLNSNHLSQVVKIIRDNMPSVGRGEEEIEVDINTLDNATLWKLHRFVEDCKKKKKAPSKKPAPGNRMQVLQQAKLDVQQRLSQIDAGLQGINAGVHDSRPVATGSGVHLQNATNEMADDSPSDSDSDADDGGAGSASSAL